MRDSHGTSEQLGIALRSDGSLLRRFRQGEQDAATALYLRYAARLQVLARAQTGRVLSSRFDPEDVVQSVFRTFFRRASEGYYQVPPGDELWQLLLVLALNKVRALAVYHKAGKRDIRQTMGSEQLGQSRAGEQGENEVAFTILRMLLDEVLAELPTVQREMVELRIEGHEISSISQRTARSKRTVERVLQQFRSRLTERIDDKSCHGDNVE
jgi:RNA polymerase sigma-70 factor (ECF subfamily)